MDIDAKQFLQTLFSSAVNEALPKITSNLFYLKTFFIALLIKLGALS